MTLRSMALSLTSTTMTSPMIPSAGCPRAARMTSKHRRWLRFAAGVHALLLAIGVARAASHPWIESFAGAATCGECHDTAAAEVMGTTHWTWEYTDPTNPAGPKLGKRHVINNYCIALASNEPRCTSCHVGIGWKDNSFNFSDATKVDCLVCHDTTGTYVKTPTGAGAPATNVNLLVVAQNVGKSSRATCGACHFFGGGGDSVKHGDLDSTMKNPPRSLDVHMGTDGANFTCTRCHETSHHQISGSRYPVFGANNELKTDNQTCEKCHTTAPHTGAAATYNGHTAKVACQTCHIPYTARNKATKMVWDWSTAGVKGSDGKDQVINDASGNPVYDTKKGSFVWERGVVPEYRWFNGDMDYVSLDDTVSSNALVTINLLGGGYGDTKARIFPVKRFLGVQPYDAGADRLAVPHLFPLGTNDTTAYWKVYDWNKAIGTGMQAAGESYVGPVGWVESEMYWIQNHMVAPKSEALTCASCHTPRGRLDFAALGYPPDRVLRLSTISGFEVDSLSANPATGEVELRWQGTANKSYQVQYSEDLKAWQDAPSGSVATGPAAAPLSWKEPLVPTPRYYRIIRF